MNNRATVAIKKLTGAVPITTNYRLSTALVTTTLLLHP